MTIIYDVLSANGGVEYYEASKNVEWKSSSVNNVSADHDLVYIDGSYVVMLVIKEEDPRLWEEPNN